MAQASNSRSRRGAVGTTTGFLGRTRAVVGHHSHTLQDSLKRLVKDPLQTTLTTSVIAIALSLPATLFVAVDNFRQLGSGFESFSQITAYIVSNATSEQIVNLENQLKTLPEVESVSYVAPDQALEEFVNSSGFGSALEYLETNPLPPVFVVKPKVQARSPDQAKRLMVKINQMDHIEDAQLDMLWLQRLHSLTQIGQQAVVTLGTLLGLGVLVVIGNSIRLAIHSRREEIIVVKLVGGTDAYVRRPFLYSGVLMGFLGAIGASCTLALGFWWLGGSVAHLSDLYTSQYRLTGPGIIGFATLVATGSMLGLLGSWLAVSRHLKHIKPR